MIIKVELVEVDPLHQVPDRFRLKAGQIWVAEPPGIATDIVVILATTGLFLSAKEMGLNRLFYQYLHICLSNFSLEALVMTSVRLQVQWHSG